MPVRLAAINLLASLSFSCLSSVPHDRVNAQSNLQSDLHSRVVSDLKKYDAHIAILRQSFAQLPPDPLSIDWVQKSLAHMFEVDQFTRKYTDVIHEQNYSAEEIEFFWKEFGDRWQAVDRGNTDALKQLLTFHEWFKISNFGHVADNHGWLIVQHADHDRSFQKSVLSILRNLYPTGETSRRNYAYLEDRVAVGEGRNQRFGTQGNCVSPGQWQPATIEKPETIDQRRAEMDLEPLAEYIARFKEICK